MRRLGRSSWEEWGQLDPLWAIFTQKGKELGQWDVDEFFASGDETIETLWHKASELQLLNSFERALDFGCGVGRLSRPLSQHFESVLGLDVSPSMIDLARTYNADSTGLTFAIHTSPDLSGLESGAFDLVCCLLVLQHLPSEAAMLGYLREFLRVLKPDGLLMLQFPTRFEVAPKPTGLRQILRPRTRIANGLHRLGVPPAFLFHHLHWRPEMTMRTVSEATLAATVRDAGAAITWRSEESDTDTEDNVFYFVTKH